MSWYRVLIKCEGHGYDFRSWNRVLIECESHEKMSGHGIEY